MKTRTVSTKGINGTPGSGDPKSLNHRQVPLGASYLGNGLCAFNVWAPGAKSVQVILNSDAPRNVRLKADSGYHFGVVEGVMPGARYMFQIDDLPPRPDPASRFQPVDVHSESEVVPTLFDWTDRDWFGIPLRDYIIYELHIGTFTEEGTFDAIIPRLAELRELGITAIELMPIAQFPGARNWGYDGVLPFAVQNSYGGPQALKRLVNACHQQRLAVILDVVYNHVGPEGNYLREFGPYFTSTYKTPWGEAINFDGAGSDHVRRFFIENALYWQREFHIDALRLDAVHAIRDFSARPFLQELVEATRVEAERLNRRFYLIAESDLNDARLIRPECSGGVGLDAQWSDDFHHCLHVLLTDERDGYYEDFGGLEQLAAILRQGYAFTGQFSRHRQRRHGNVPENTGLGQFVVYSQNHDQVGNRFMGDRLSDLVGFDRLKLAAGAVLLSPFVPMLFMGEEYGETRPFQYFVSHSDPALVEAVRNGRREEFAAFESNGDAPDPFSMETFKRCMLDRRRLEEKQHLELWNFYRELIRLRKSLPVLNRADRKSMKVEVMGSAGLWVQYSGEPAGVLIVFNFSDETLTENLNIPPDLPLVLDSTVFGETRPGTVETVEPWSFKVFARAVSKVDEVSFERSFRSS
jgi:malto-oligosyltrehalose trehalohydrolase